MDLRQLQAFVAVAEELHFRNAAERIGMAQAAVSSRIRDLEGELGFELFFRTTRDVSLTQAGFVFLDGVRETLNTLENGISAANVAAKTRFERLRIGGIDEALIWYLPSILAEFKAKFPTVSMPITESSSSAEQIQSLESHRIDIAFFRPPTVRAGLKHEVLYQERAYVALPRDHRFANRPGAVSFAELAEDPIISYPHHARPHLNRLVVDGFAKENLKPDICMEVIDKFTALQLVANGLGVAILPEWFGMLYMPNIPLRPLAMEGFALQFGVAWRENDNSETLREFLGHVMSHASKCRKKMDQVWDSRMAQEDWASKLDLRSWDNIEINT
jgi:DNA-binding transcriptional LysR family regulator